MDGNMATVVVALCSFAGTALGVIAGNKLIAYRLQQLEIKVDKHNNFAVRIPLIERDLEELKKLKEARA